MGCLPLQLRQLLPLLQVSSSSSRGGGIHDFSKGGALAPARQKINFEKVKASQT